MFSDKDDKGKPPRKPPISNQLQRRNEATAAHLEPTRNDVSVKTSFRALRILSTSKSSEKCQRSMNQIRVTENEDLPHAKTKRRAMSIKRMKEKRKHYGQMKESRWRPEEARTPGSSFE
uniref:BZIP domain-containing protein n=1 Tax=Panagrellus redivivus TaxID=6233 RepID=A0A7E4VY67_PANRE